MTLTLALLVLLGLFLLSAILLPLNRVRVFSISSFSAFVPVGFIYLLNGWMEKNFIEQEIGKVFFPVFSFLFPTDELTLVEKRHLSFSFFLLFLYLILYIIVLLFTKRYYVGNNPSFHKRRNLLTKFLVSSVYFWSAFIVVFLFLVNIREILPFPDGWFQDFFSVIYPIEA